MENKFDSLTDNYEKPVKTIGKKILLFFALLTVTFLAVLFLLLGSRLNFKHKVNQKQAESAETFLNYIIANNPEKAYDLFEPESKKEVDFNTFNEAAEFIYDLSRQFNSKIEPYMHGYKGIPANRYIFYNYRFSADVSKIPGFLLEVYFKDKKSTNISGVHYAQRTFPLAKPDKIPTSTAEEISLSGELNWIIDGREVIIHDIALIKFSKGNILSIKVFSDTIPTGKKAKENGIPLAKKAIDDGYFEKAREMSMQNNYPFLNDIGIAFIDKNTHGGYRVLLKQEDYN